jgi:hypothetical protein
MVCLAGVYAECNTSFPAAQEGRCHAVISCRGTDPPTRPNSLSRSVVVPNPGKCLQARLAAVRIVCNPLKCNCCPCMQWGPACNLRRCRSFLLCKRLHKRFQNDRGAIVSTSKQWPSLLAEALLSYSILQDALLHQLKTRFAVCKRIVGRG